MWLGVFSCIGVSVSFFNFVWSPAPHQSDAITSIAIHDHIAATIQDLRHGCRSKRTRPCWKRSDDSSFGESRSNSFTGKNACESPRLLLPAKSEIVILKKWCLNQTKTAVLNIKGVPVPTCTWLYTCNIMRGDHSKFSSCKKTDFQIIKYFLFSYCQYTTNKKRLI